VLACEPFFSLALAAYVSARHLSSSFCIIARVPLIAGLNILFTLHFLSDMTILHLFFPFPTRPHLLPLEISHLFYDMAKPHLQKIPQKHSKILRRKIRLLYILYLYAADYDHLRLTSRSFAILPACCERRRPCDLKPSLHPIPHDTCGLSGRDLKLLFLGLCSLFSFFRFGPPMMY
jgi:hypothetical protein